MDLIKYQKFSDDAIMCEFDCYFAEEACEKLFAVDKMKIDVCELTFKKSEDELDACNVTSYDEVKAYGKNAVTVRFDGSYTGEETAAVIDFNAKFLAVRSVKESICYDLAREVVVE